MAALTQFVRRAARINARGTATICGDRQRTWSEVLDRITRAAGMLRDLGLEPDDRVAILSPNSDDYLEHLFAVNWAGGVIVPINTRLAPPEIVDWIDDAGARFLVRVVRQLERKVPARQSASSVRKNRAVIRKLAQGEKR